MALDEVKKYLHDNADSFETTLTELLKIPTISAESEHRPDMIRGAEWLADYLTKMGLPMVETLPTVDRTSGEAKAGNPVVYAETPYVAGAPTVLVYGHYDVQPVDPVELWKTSPFEPIVQNRRMYGRGTSDDKGQLMTHIFATEAWMKTAGHPPLNIRFCFEGEEETSSGGLEDLLQREPQRFACDAMVVSDTCQFGPNRPAITCGLRGISYCEVELIGPNRDLHSGTFGGAVTNPANALTRILADMIDADGRVQIPGFYDSVVELTTQEREEIRQMPFDEKAFFDELEVTSAIGEKGYSTTERRWIRPTFDINGIWGGFQGEGSKTVLPAKASAKFSFRLVPNQDPDVIAEATKAWIEKRLPAGVTMKFTYLHGGRGVLSSTANPFVRAAAVAVEEAFGVAPLYMRDGGSIPIIAKFAEIVNPAMLLVGLGLDMDQIHSPNESFSMDDFQKGILSSAILWEKLAQVK